MREVLKFKDNNIEYLLLAKKGKLIPVKKINQKLIYTLDDAEILLIKQVFSKVMPTNKVVNLGILNKFNKQFNHYYDYFNEYHLFWEQKEMPSLTDFIKLNIIYNNEYEYDLIIDNIENRNRNEKIKRIVHQGTKTLVVILSIVDIYFFVKLGSALYHNIESFYVNPALNKIEEMFDVSYADNLTISDVINYLNQNPNLNEDEKAYLTSFTDFFTDELPYMDRRNLIDNLENLNPLYYPEQNGDIRGAWFNSGKDIFKIKIWESKSTDQYLDENDKYVLRHEFFHAWSQKKGSKLQIGYYLYEFLNHTLSNEYAYVFPGDKGYDTSYLELENYGRVFFNLIDANVLREFHATKNLKVLITELKKIIPNEELAYQLIAQTDEYYQAKREYEKNITDQDKEKTYQVEDRHLKKLLTLYWEQKYHQKVNEDLYIYFLLDFQNAYLQIKESFSDYQITNITLEKAYFNPRLDLHKKIKLQFGDNKEIVINEAGELILKEENGLNR